MATYNEKRNGVNNQKRAVSVTIADTAVKAAGDILELATIPGECIINSAQILVTKIDTGTTPTVDVKVGGTTLGSGLDLAALGVDEDAIAGTSAYQKLGGDLTATFGGTPTGDGEFKVILTYTELEKTIGEYTN